MTVSLMKGYSKSICISCYGVIKKGSKHIGINNKPICFKCAKEVAGFLPNRSARTKEEASKQQ